MAFWSLISPSFSQLSSPLIETEGSNAAGPLTTVVQIRFTKYFKIGQ